MNKEQSINNPLKPAFLQGAVSGSFITVENCMRLGNVDGIKFMTEEGEIKTAKKFVFSDAGTPYLYWGDYEAYCLIPAINLRMRQGMIWL